MHISGFSVSDIDDLLSRDLSYHPSTPGEVALAIALVIPSLMFFIYLMVVLYRCMCSKHYAEWRTSWKNSSGLDSNRSMYSECSAADANLVMETFPLKLRGHSQVSLFCFFSSVFKKKMIPCSICFSKISVLDMKM